MTFIARDGVEVDERGVSLEVANELRADAERKRGLNRERNRRYYYAHQEHERARSIEKARNYPAHKKNEASKRWRESRPEDYRRARAKYHEANKDERNTANKKWMTENKDRRKVYSRRKNLKKKYGISLEERDAILAAQGGKCANPGCGAAQPEAKNLRDWNVDHDHKTGAVRGILCGGCNRGLGQFKDDAARLRGAADYLNKFKCDEVDHGVVW